MDLSIKPSSDEYFNLLAEKIFSPLFLGNSILLQTIPKSGVRGFIKHMLHYPENVSEEFPNSLKDKKTLWFTCPKIGVIDSNNPIYAVDKDAENPINSDDTAQIQSSIQQMGAGTIMFVHEAENLFQNHELYQQLKQIYDVNNTTLAICFITTRELQSEEVKELTTTFAIFNTSIIPLKSDKEIALLLDKEEVWKDIKIKEDIKSFIVANAGGYSILARAMLQYIYYEGNGIHENIINDLEASEAIRIPMQLLYNSLTPETQQSLLLFLLKPELQLPKFLTDSKIIDKDKIFSPIFENYLITIHNENFKIDNGNDRLEIYNLDLREILSPQEYLTYRHIYDAKGELVSKEDVAKLLHGNEWSENYSDWAIDSLIKSIRKKLRLKKSNVIETVRHKGYKYIS